MARSNTGPSFFKSAGARLTIVLAFPLWGGLKPEFLIAAIILSLASSTLLSGKPTIENDLSPREISTSTSTISGFNPATCALCTLANMPKFYHTPYFKPLLLQGHHLWTINLIVWYDKSSWVSPFDYFSIKVHVLIVPRVFFEPRGF